ncbi:nucleotidyltransferase family protein [Nocardioides marmoraquaticus]
MLLAAGAGRRMGRPKALVDDWLLRGVATLAPCDRVVVVLGAQAETARERVPDGVEVVVADDWDEGMGASLRAGLAAVAAGEHVVVTLVDLPDVDRRVVERLLAEPVTGATLRRAAYDAVPGHPVLLGADHVAGVAAGAVGDEGARGYLREREVGLVECGDLATGADVDSLSGPGGS